MLLALYFLLIVFSNAFEPRRVRLGVDYGPRLVGLASSDLFGQVHPMQTLKNSGDLIQLSSTVLTRAQSLGAVEVVVGVPSDFDGRYDHKVRNFNGQLCLNFSTVLATLSMNKYENKIKVFLFDEKYTTKEAKLRLQMDRKKASIDAVAAGCLLRRYLECQGEGRVSAPHCDYPIPPSLANFDYGLVKEYIRSLYYEKMSDGDMSESLRNVVDRIRQPVYDDDDSDDEEEEDDGLDDETRELLAIREQRTKVKGLVTRKPF